VSEPAYSVRSTLLKCVARSPAHAKAFIDGGMNDETLSMRLGTGGHALLFGTPPVVVFYGTRRGKVWDEFQAENEGSVILNEREHGIATAMARAIQTHPDADRLLFSPGTQHEVLVEWMVGGRRCTGRLDSLGPQAIGDLKCVQDASPNRFPWQARKMGYHMQLAWYRDGVELAGLGERDCYLIAVENSAPHNVQVYRMTDADMDLGRATYNALLDRLLECEAADYWPGYADGILPLNVLGLPMEEDDDEESEAA
jgi:hypothetical protein